MVKFATPQGDVYLRDIENRGRKVKQLLWGDFLNVEEETTDGWAKVKWGADRYWVRQQDCQDERPLEVVFVDVGQGDGCLVVTPQTGADERIVLIDAGERRNMYNFIAWRFGKLTKHFRFHAAVVTHSDKDHYGGFQPFFEQKMFSFATVHHNGIAERDKRTCSARATPRGVSSPTSWPPMPRCVPSTPTRVSGAPRSIPS